MDNQNPQVIYTPEALQPAKKSWFRPKILLYVLIAVILGEIVWGIKTMLTPVTVKKVAQSAVLTDANLSLSANKKDVKVGEIFPVVINLSTGAHRTVGTDIVLRYDPKILDASQSAFIKGTVYPDYPSIQVDNTNGVITASGVIAVNGGGFSGIGPFGEVWFRAKSKGQTAIKLDFTKDSYTGSNIVEVGTAKNVLSTVANLEVNIQ